MPPLLVPDAYFETPSFLSRTGGYSVLARNFIPFEKLPIGSLMVEAILAHEYPVRK